MDFSRGLVVAVIFASGCVLAPRGALDERAAMEQAGRPYEAPFAERALPELPAEPGWQDVLRRASLANGELEAAYFEWAAAVHRVQRAGGYPNTPLAIDFEQMFDGGTSFDDTSITIRPDPMENLAFPSKVSKAGELALSDARAAGRRFTAAKLELQRRVLAAWVEYALQAERQRIQQGHLSLLGLMSETAVARVQTGAAQQELLRAEVEQRRGEDELRSLEAALPQTRALLNAMMARAPEAPLALPRGIPAPRPLPADDAALLVLTAQRNPELAALAHGVEGREDALELARLQYIPDFNPFLGFTGTVAQLVGIGVSIPTFLPEVAGMVKEAKADLREARAKYRQTSLDRAAQVVAALYAVRNSERQTELFERRIIPAAERIIENVQSAYSAAAGSFSDVIDAQRVLLDTRLAAAEARAARETSLADLEALVGAELSTATANGLHASAEAARDESAMRAAGEGRLDD